MGSHKRACWIKGNVLSYMSVDTDYMARRPGNPKEPRDGVSVPQGKQHRMMLILLPFSNPGWAAPRRRGLQTVWEQEDQARISTEGWGQDPCAHKYQTWCKALHSGLAGEDTDECCSNYLGLLPCLGNETSPSCWRAWGTIGPGQCICL